MPRKRPGSKVSVMKAPAVEDANIRLRELRHVEWEDLGLAALTMSLALVATQVLPELAIPLFLGGLVIGTLGLRALWQHWDLVDRLAGERDAYVIPDVFAYASREATMERRRTFAGVIRGYVRREGAADSPLGAVRDEFERLASELENDGLALDPASAVACSCLLRDLGESPLVDLDVSSEELRFRIGQIRYGFEPRRLAE